MHLKTLHGVKIKNTIIKNPLSLTNCHRHGGHPSFRTDFGSIPAEGAGLGLLGTWCAWARQRCLGYLVGRARWMIDAGKIHH